MVQFLFLSSCILSVSLCCYCCSFSMNKVFFVRNNYVPNVDIFLLVCSEFPPPPSDCPVSSPRQPSHDASQSDTSVTDVSRSPPSPMKRPTLSPSCSETRSPTAQAVALYDFDGDASLGDLVFQAGETIVDIRSVSEEWMSGCIGDRTGNFPTAFVKLLWCWIITYTAGFILWSSSLL